jgi:hypothetical protein
MRCFILLMLLLQLFLNQCASQKSANEISELPNDSLINNAIFAIVQLDSLKKEYGIGQKIFKPDIYTRQKWDGNLQTPPPPPPPNNFGCSYDEILGYFNSENNSKNRVRDSIFIVHQIDTIINHQIQDRIANIFKHRITESYYFSTPIFSNDMNSVFVAYSDDYYMGYLTVLKKKDGKWIKQSHKYTWER